MHNGENRKPNGFLMFSIGMYKESNGMQWVNTVRLYEKGVISNTTNISGVIVIVLVEG